MSLNCDLCGGQVTAQGDGAVCPHCGMTYDNQWLRQRYVNPPAAPLTPYTPPPKKKKRNFTWAAVVFAVCAFLAFIAGFISDEDPVVSLGLFGFCALAVTVTIFIIKILNKDD